MTDPITAEVEGLFDDIDSVDLRAKLRRRTRRLRSVPCTRCNGTGELSTVYSDGDAVWRPCPNCYPEVVV